MEKEYVQAVIILIGGAQLPGENMRRYLGRVSLITDVDFYSVRDAYYTGRLSKKAQAKFEKALQRARHPHDLIAYVQLKLTIWERDPETYRDLIDATRPYLAEMDRIRRAASGRDVSGRTRSGRAAEAGPAGLAPACAAAT